MIWEVCDGAVRQVLRHHQRRGVERRLHRGAGAVGAGIVDRGADEAEQRHCRDGEDHRDIALIGAGEMAGGRTNATENGCFEHGSHRNWFLQPFRLTRLNRW